MWLSLTTRTGKQKKQQLQAKREKKRLEDDEDDDGYAAPHAPDAAGDAVAPAPDDGKTVIMAGRAAQPKAPVRDADPNRCASWRSLLCSHPLLAPASIFHLFATIPSSYAQGN